MFNNAKFLKIYKINYFKNSTLIIKYKLQKIFLLIIVILKIIMIQIDIIEIYLENIFD